MAQRESQVVRAFDPSEQSGFAKYTSTILERHMPAAEIFDGRVVQLLRERESVEPSLDRLQTLLLVKTWAEALLNFGGQHGSFNLLEGTGQFKLTDIPSKVLITSGLVTDPREIKAIERRISGRSLRTREEAENSVTIQALSWESPSLPPIVTDNAQLRHDMPIIRLIERYTQAVDLSQGQTFFVEMEPHEQQPEIEVEGTYFIGTTLMGEPQLFFANESLHNTHFHVYVKNAGWGKISKDGPDGQPHLFQNPAWNMVYAQQPRPDGIATNAQLATMAVIMRAASSASE